MPVLLRRTVGFHATHRFWVPAWSADRNRARFGWTSEEPGHGHDYRCRVTVRGAGGGDPDLVIDLPDLDRILAEEVVAPLDGKHINLDLPEFAYGRRLPTCEALARYLFQRIVPRLPPEVTLAGVLVAEDETLEGEYSADDTGPGHG